MMEHEKKEGSSECNGETWETASVSQDINELSEKIAIYLIARKDF